MIIIDIFLAIFSMIRTILAFIIIFIPGYLLTRVLFPTKETPTTELITWTITLSLTTTPLFLLPLHYLFKITINPWSILATITFISLASLPIYLLEKEINNLYKKEKQAAGKKQ